MLSVLRRLPRCWFRHACRFTAASHRALSCLEMSGRDWPCRGAAAADFVEQNARLCETVDSNLEHTGFTHRAKVYRMRVEQALPVLERPYQLVLADPPYNLTNMNQIIELLSRPGLLDAAGLVVIEHSSRVAVPEECGALQRRDQRRYGDTELSIYGPIYSPTYIKEGT